MTRIDPDAESVATFVDVRRGSVWSARSSEFAVEDLWLEQAGARFIEDVSLPEPALLFAQYGPGVAGTVIAGIALIVARHILGALWRALSWIGQAILPEVKWRIGWWQ